MQVAAWERSTLYGIVVNPPKRVNFGPIDPPEAREIFIRQGWSAARSTRDCAALAVLAAQQEADGRDRVARAQVAPAGRAGRRRTIYAFYDHVPGRHPQRRRLRQVAAGSRARKPKLLVPQARGPDAPRGGRVTTDVFPADQARRRGYALTITSSPAAADDGVTLTVPLPHLNQVPALRCEWLVPGLLRRRC